jgi:hypothetical protein
MDDNEEQRRYGDSTILEPIVEQQDDEVMKFQNKIFSLKFSFK